MTHEDWVKLTPDEQRVKIAELCGWKVMRHGPVMASGCYGCFGYPPDRHDWIGYENIDVPNYLNDLNDMHEAEKMLGDRSSPLWSKYIQHLNNSSYVDLQEQTVREWVFSIHATAAQRAEAFVLTMCPN